MTEESKSSSAAPSPHALADQERLAELAATGVADGRSDELFDRFARIAATLLQAPVSYVSLVGVEKQVMPGAAVLDEPGEPDRELPLSASICSLSVASGEETVIADVRTDPVVRGKHAMQDLGIRSYAGWPLTTTSGQVLGNLCVMDRAPREWTDTELATLRDLATLVMEELRHRVTKTRLAGLRSDAHGLWTAVPEASDAVRLLAEQADRSEQPELQRAASTATARMDVVARAAGRLRPELETAAAGLDPEPVEVARAVQRAAASTRAATGGEVDVRLDVDDERAWVACDPLALERALSRLLVASVQHAADGRLEVRLRPDGEVAVLEVRAGGPGMPLTHLSRAVARLDAALHLRDRGAGDVYEMDGTASGAGPRADRRGAAVRFSAGVATATAGTVVGTAGPHGTLVRATLGR